MRAFMLQGIIWTVAICAGVPVFFENERNYLVSKKTDADLLGRFYCDRRCGPEGGHACSLFISTIYHTTAVNAI